MIQVVRAVFHPYIIISIILLVTYVALVVYLLFRLQIWDFGQLKQTALWTAFSAIAAMLRIPGAEKTPKLLRKWINDNVRISVLVVFVTSLYPLPLPAELLLVPTVAVLVAVAVIAEMKEEFQFLSKLLNGCLSLIVLLLIAYASIQIYVDFDNFAKLENLRQFYTPPLLSLIITPFLYALFVYVGYEVIFLQLGVAIPDGRLRRYAMWKAAISFRHRTGLLKRWYRHTVLCRPSRREDVKRQIQEVLTTRLREKNPPYVAPNEGWSPYVASRFLHENGLEAGEYRRSIDGWTASAPYLKIGHGLLPDNIAYYVDGNERAATKLEVVLNVNNPSASGASEMTFRNICVALCMKALDSGWNQEAITELLARDSGIIATEDKEFRVSREDWSSGGVAGFERHFVIEHTTPKATN